MTLEDAVALATTFVRTYEQEILEPFREEGAYRLGEPISAHRMSESGAFGNDTGERWSVGFPMLFPSDVIVCGSRVIVDVDAATKEVCLVQPRGDYELNK